MTDRKINPVFVIGLIVLAVLLVNQSQFFSIFSGESLPYNTTTMSSELEAVSWSSFPYGEINRVGRFGSFVFTQEDFRLEADPGGSCTLQDDKPCGTNSLSISQNISAEGNSIVYDLDAIGSNARPNSVAPIGATSILVVRNKVFNTDIVERFEFDYDFKISTTGNPWDPGVAARSVAVHLSNEQTNILIHEISVVDKSISSSGKIIITKNPAGIGYVLDVGSSKSNLNIPIGEYFLTVKTKIGGTFDSSSFGGKKHITIMNVNVQNTEVITTVYRLIDNVCEQSEINQNDVLSTDFSELSDCQSNIVEVIEDDVENNTTIEDSTDSDGAACPSVCVPLYETVGDECFFDSCGSGCGANNVTTFETIEECREALPEDSILNKLLGPSFILIIIISGVLWFTLGRKK